MNCRASSLCAYRAAPGIASQRRSVICGVVRAVSPSRTVQEALGPCSRVRVGTRSKFYTFFYLAEDTRYHGSGSFCVSQTLGTVLATMLRLLEVTRRCFFEKR